MNFVEKLITYCETQNFTDLNLTNCIDQENLNVIVIEILSWLQLQRKRELWIEQGRKAKLKPMTLNMKYAWCSEFVSYIHQDNIFGDYLCVQNDTVDFKSDLSEDLKHQFRVFAYEQYIPETMS